MRLKQFINESRGQSISIDEASKLIKEKCKDALNELKKGNVIYRGVNSPHPSFMISPSKSTRVSLNTENYYTLINDNSPSWAKYPKRSKSIICTTEYSTADFYGNVYIVLPFDTAKIGMCASSDYWVSFPFLKKSTGIEDMAVFNDNLKYIFNIPYINKNVGSIKNVKTYDELKKLFNSFDNFIKKSDDEIIKNMKDEYRALGKKFKEPKHSPTLKKILSEYSYIALLKGYEDFMNLERYIQYLLDPKRNKFKLKTIGDKLPPRTEVWTDSDSILVRAYYIDSLDKL